MKPKVESNKTQDNFSDAETIPSAERYRDTTKKDEIYRRNPKKKAIKILTRPLYNKESSSKLKRKADKELVEIIDDDYSDAETIQYAEPHRETFTKKDKIYRKKAKKKAIKTLNKKRKLKLVADSSDEQDNLSDAETIPYAEPYRSSFTKKDEIYSKKTKKKAIKTLTKKKKTSTKKTKTIKVVEPKENDDLKITGFTPITHPRTKKQIKEKAVAHANSAAVQLNLGIDLENLVDIPLVFNLRMTSEMEIEDWLVENLALNHDEYYIGHKQGTNVFRITKEPDTESNNSEMVLNKHTFVI